VKAFAYLTVVVLAVIAIGVSLVTGLPNLQPVRTYGSEPLRFEVAFPAGLVGKLQGSLPVPGLALFAAGPYTSGTTFAIMGVDRSALRASGTNHNGGAYFYTTYFPIQPGPTSTYFAGGFKTVREPVRCGAYRPRYVQVNLQTGSPPSSGAGSESGAIRLPNLCWVSEVVSGHGLKWYVSGVTPTSSIIEQFVDSFKPLGASA
jgi:hypothetical protein